VFGNPIGSYQAVQHPLADSWAKLEQDELMVRKAAWLYDNSRDCGAEANAVKLRASEDALEACERAVRAHGGMGYASEYDVEAVLARDDDQRLSADIERDGEKLHRGTRPRAAEVVLIVSSPSDRVRRSHHRCVLPSGYY